MSPHRLSLQGVAEAECRRAAAAAEEVYSREFNMEGVSAEGEALLQEHLVRVVLQRCFLHQERQQKAVKMLCSAAPSWSRSSCS